MTFHSIDLSFRKDESDFVTESGIERTTNTAFIEETTNTVYVPGISYTTQQPIINTLADTTSKALTSTTYFYSPEVIVTHKCCGSDPPYWFVYKDS